MGTTELTNMVMVYDREQNRAVVQKRVKSWKGITFPGGHVEEGESFVDSAVREIWEETGLRIQNLQSCGVIHWCNKDTDDRYLVFLYKTCDYTGQLLESTEEGAVWWEDLDRIPGLELSNHFSEYLPMFLKDGLCEAFGSHDDAGDGCIVYR